MVNFIDLQAERSHKPIISSVFVTVLSNKGGTLDCCKLIWCYIKPFQLFKADQIILPRRTSLVDGSKRISLENIHEMSTYVHVQIPIRCIIKRLRYRCV
jgi:hypothetical protein